MRIELNGQFFVHDELSTVESLLGLKGVHGQRVAVMVNDSVVKKDQFAATKLHDGDRVELISMVGGG